MENSIFSAFQIYKNIENMKNTEIKITKNIESPENMENSIFSAFQIYKNTENMKNTEIKIGKNRKHEKQRFSTFENPEKSENTVFRFFTFTWVDVGFAKLGA